MIVSKIAICDWGKKYQAVLLKYKIPWYPKPKGLGQDVHLSGPRLQEDFMCNVSVINRPL